MVEVDQRPCGDARHERPPLPALRERAEDGRGVCGVHERVGHPAKPPNPLG